MELAYKLHSGHHLNTLAVKAKQHTQYFFYPPEGRKKGHYEALKPRFLRATYIYAKAFVNFHIGTA